MWSRRGGLVHKEFEARGLPYFEAVRVPIQRGSSLVLDTRCLPGGAPGGLRAYAYGLIYDDDTEPDSAAAALENDYLTTVDILDYAPVGTWGSRNKPWGSTAAAAFRSLS